MKTKNLNGNFNVVGLNIKKYRMEEYERNKNCNC